MSKKLDESDSETCGWAGEQRTTPSVGAVDSSVGALTATSGVLTVDEGAVDTMCTDSLCLRGASCAISSYKLYTTNSLWAMLSSSAYVNSHYLTTREDEFPTQHVPTVTTPKMLIMSSKFPTSRPTERAG